MPMPTRATPIRPAPSIGRAGRRALGALLLLGALALTPVVPATAATAATAGSGSASASPWDASAINLGYGRSYSGLRVCGVFDSADQRGGSTDAIGTGLAVVVKKGDINGCLNDTAYMTKYYQMAFGVHTSVHSHYEMITCEDFARRTNTEPDPRDQVSPCNSMQKDVFYKVFTERDLIHPQAQVSLQRWP
jgi:hypothetical protein